MNQHLWRWTTGLIAAPLLFIFLIYSTEKLFSWLIIAIILIAAWEYAALSFGKKGNAWEKGELLFFSLIIPLSASLSDFVYFASAITFCFLLSSLIFLVQIKEKDIDFADLEKVILGFVYLPLLMSYFIFLRHLPEGKLWVFFTLAVIFSGDILAYYAGKTAGRNKLQPRISPGKTVEGMIGMIVGSIAASLLLGRLVLTELHLVHALVLGFFGALLGQLGDLFESSIKRAAGVKDAGAIIPGHGGIMDRLDSLSFFAPFVFYYQRFVIT